MIERNNSASSEANTTDISIPELQAALKGRVITPGDDGYDEARTAFPGDIDRYPALIVRVEDATDVSRVVTLARETGLELAVKSGGLPGT